MAQESSALPRAPGTSTLAVHAGEKGNPLTSLVTPIVQASTFRLEDAAAGAAAMAAVEPTTFYSRWGNPTVRVTADAIAALEGAERALLFASGMGAIHGLLSALVASGERVVAARSLYSGTTGILTGLHARNGVAVEFVDAVDLEAMRAALSRPARMVLVETISNPTLEIADLQEISRLARDCGALLAVDSTFASPVLCRPLRVGADLVIHSTTKYLGGHSDCTGGAIAGANTLLEEIWETTHLMGACLAPMEAFLLRRGMRTLELRLSRQCESALEVATALASHRAVTQVHYPGLASHPQHALACRQFGDRCGGMVSFEVAGGAEAARRVVESSELIQLAVSLGGVESIWEHPASMSHATVGADHLEAAGIASGLIRLSVGIEDTPDLLDDLERALAAAGAPSSG